MRVLNDITRMWNDSEFAKFVAFRKNGEEVVELQSETDFHRTDGIGKEDFLGAGYMRKQRSKLAAYFGSGHWRDRLKRDRPIEESECERVLREIVSAVRVVLRSKK